MQGTYEAVRLQPLKAATAAAAGLSGAAAWWTQFMSTSDTALTLVAGAMLVRWLTDHVEPWGLGEGITLIICTSITARTLPPPPPPLSHFQELLNAPQQMGRLLLC